MRVLATAVDQAFSALSNVLFVLLVARGSSPVELGVVSVGVLSITTFLGLSRASVGSSLSLAAQGGIDHIRWSSDAALRFTVQFLGPVVFMVTTISMLLVSATASVPLGPPLMVALAAPIVMVQDMLRFTASSSGTPSRALISDSAWLVTLLAVASVPMVLGNQLTPTWASAGWLLGSLVALCIIWRGMGSRVSSRRQSSEWLKSCRLHLLSAATAPALLLGASLVRTLAIGTVLGASVVGALSAGLLLVSPVNLLHALILFGLMPILASRRLAPGRLAASYLAGGLVAAAAAFLWGIAVTLAPQWWGEKLLGESWAEGRSLLVPMVLLSASTGLLASASAAFMALSRARPLVTVSAVVGVMNLGLAACAIALQMDAYSLALVESFVFFAGGFLAWLLLALPWRKAKLTGSRESSTEGPSQ